MYVVNEDRAEIDGEEFGSAGLLMSGTGGSAAGLGLALVVMHNKGSFGTGQCSAGKMDLGEADDVVEDDSCASLLSLLDWKFGTLDDLVEDDSCASLLSLLDCKSGTLDDFVEDDSSASLMSLHDCKSGTLA